MNFTARGSGSLEPSPYDPVAVNDPVVFGGWLWERLKSAGKAITLGQVIADARNAGFLPPSDPDKPKVKLKALYNAKKWVATAHHGWHVEQVEAPEFGGKPGKKMWVLATGPDPDLAPDYDVIRATVDLKRFVENDLGPPLKGGRWACPIHGGSGPNFAVHGERWKCWTCGQTGDVVDYLAKRENIPVDEAARRLDPSAATKPFRPISRPVPIEPPKPPVSADEAWQLAVDRVIADAEVALWSKSGRLALDWLRGRGLDDSTIRQFRLGFNPADHNTEPLEALELDRRGRARGLWVRRGIVIPWAAPGSWYGSAVSGSTDRPKWVGANVRRLADNFGDPTSPPKYHALAGSDRGHGYPWPEASAPGVPALVCEGEFDSLVAWQEAGWLANVVTFGGAGQNRETDDAKAFLTACPDWLLLFDQDDAGDGAARAMARRARHRCRRLYLPPGVNDLNDLHRLGAGRVLNWVHSEFKRFGWSTGRISA